MISLTPGAVPPDGSDQVPAESEPQALPTAEVTAILPFAGSANFSPAHSKSSLLPLVNDQRATQRLLELMLIKAGLTVPQAARQLGISDEAVRQYIVGRRAKPSLWWFLRFCQLCNAKVTIEFPK